MLRLMVLQAALARSGTCLVFAHAAALPRDQNGGEVHFKVKPNTKVGVRYLASQPALESTTVRRDAWAAVPEDHGALCSEQGRQPPWSLLGLEHLHGACYRVFHLLTCSHSWVPTWQAVNVEHLRFLFEGRRVESYNTPSELGLEADDVIDAVQEQVCTSCSWWFNAMVPALC